MRWLKFIAFVCPGACLVGFLADPVSAPAQNTVVWSTNYYVVTGATLDEIRQSIQRARPWRHQNDHVGWTEWWVRARWSTAPFHGAHRPSGFTTLTTIRITLPRWHPPKDVAEEIRDEWERYLAALLEHEAGHGRMATAAAAEMHRRVRALGPLPDGHALSQQVDRLVEEVLSEYRERDREYDRLTGHGRTQGVTLRRDAALAFGTALR